MTENELRALQERVARLETTVAVNGERFKHIEESLNRINNTMNRLVMVVVGVIITALLNLLMNGGFPIG